jgi:hypothetical protein
MGAIIFGVISIMAVSMIWNMKKAGKIDEDDSTF